MYSYADEKSVAAARELEAAGYDVEDWAQNDLGVAKGWWSKGHVPRDVEEAERREDFKRQVQKRATGRVASRRPEVRALQLAGGALRRAAKKGDSARVAELLTSLQARPTAAVDLVESGICRIVGKLRSSQPEPGARVARELVDDWKRRLAASGLAQIEPRLPFRTADEIPVQTGDPRRFAVAFDDKMRTLAEAATPSSVGVVHGYGTLAARPLERGLELLDPAAYFVDGAADPDDVRAGRVVLAPGGHFVVRTDTKAAPTFYLNEARPPRPPNLEWLVQTRGTTACLFWRLLVDVAPNVELLVVYDPRSDGPILS